MALWQSIATAFLLMLLLCPSARHCNFKPVFGQQKQTRQSPGCVRHYIPTEQIDSRNRGPVQDKASHSMSKKEKCITDQRTGRFSFPFERVWTITAKPFTAYCPQVFCISCSSFFISSDGGWLLVPVSCPELWRLVLAFVDLCLRVPFPMQRMRFLNVAHISSSL